MMENFIIFSPGFGFAEGRDWGRLAPVSAPNALRTLVPLVIGLALGGMAVAMFNRSLPGEPGSPELRASQLEQELKRANNELAALKATSSGRHRDTEPTLRDGLRKLADDIREGRPVTPDDLFRLMQPVLRDLAPLFDRMRVRSERFQIEAMSGELARKYDLTRDQQAALAKWLEAKSEDNARRWSAIVTQEGLKLDDMVRATSDLRLDEGLDEFMAGQISGEKLTAFQAERMAQRVERVQTTADRAVARLDSIVTLDDAQRDQVFGIAARSSRDYVPGMKLEGVGGEITSVPAGSSRDAILAVLRPEQRAAYDEERNRRYEAAAKEAAAIGMKLPEGWDPMDELE